MELEKMTRKKMGRRPIIIECEGKKMTLKEYAEYCGMSLSTVYRRFKEQEKK